MVCDGDDGDGDDDGGDDDDDDDDDDHDNDDYGDRPSCPSWSSYKVTVENGMHRGGGAHQGAGRGWQGGLRLQPLRLQPLRLHPFTRLTFQ